RPTTLDELKRTWRGNDARPWPWGNTLPDAERPLIAGSRHLLFPIQVTPLPNPIQEILDYSPFSLPPHGDQKCRLIAHFALNVLKFLSWPEDREGRFRMLQAVGLSHLDPNDPTIPSQYVFLAGGSYDQAAPSNLEIIQYKPFDFRGPAGIIPV